MHNHHLGGGQWIKACQLEPDLVLRPVRDAKGRPAAARGGGGRHGLRGRDDGVGEDREEVRRCLPQCGPWSHAHDLGDGIDPVPPALVDHVGVDLQAVLGQLVLDGAGQLPESLGPARERHR